MSALNILVGRGMLRLSTTPAVLGLVVTACVHGQPGRAVPGTVELPSNERNAMADPVWHCGSGLSLELASGEIAEGVALCIRRDLDTTLVLAFLEGRAIYRARSWQISDAAEAPVTSFVAAREDSALGPGRPCGAAAVRVWISEGRSLRLVIEHGDSKGLPVVLTLVEEAAAPRC